MLEINDTIYEGIARALVSAIGSGDYFNGSVEYVSDELCATLTATLVIYRRREVYPEGAVDEIADIVPVWWEFSTVQECGEVCNDFSFGEMKKFLGL